MKKLFLSLLFTHSAFAFSVSETCKLFRIVELVGITTRTTLEGEDMDRKCFYLQNKGLTPVLITVSTTQQSGLNGVSVGVTGVFEPKVAFVNSIYITPLAGATANVYYHTGK